MTRYHPLLAISAVALIGLSACSAPESTPSPQPGPTAQDSPAPKVSQPEVWAATIDFRWDELAEPIEYVLYCTGDRDSTFPGDVEATCNWLNANYQQLRTYRLGTVCTEQYGGPQIALISVVDSQRLKSMHPLQRTNGCYIDQWQAWNPLLEPIQQAHPQPVESEES